MYAVIMDKEENTTFWERIAEDGFHFDIFQSTGQLNLLARPDILLVSSEYLTGLPGYTFAQLRAYPTVNCIPAAAVTFDMSCENQDRLCEMGFDDVISLPMSRTLLNKRLNHLVSAALYEAEEVDPEYLSAMSYDGENGSFCVRSEDFAYIYKYVLRLLERLDRNAQMIIFDLDKNGEAPDELTLQVLSDVAQKCLRRGDMSSICGSSQVLILLIGADDEGGRLVAERIVNSFYCECTDPGVRLKYDIRAVRARKSEPESAV